MRGWKVEGMKEMWTVNVFLKGLATPVSLGFKTEDACERVFTRIAELNEELVVDDFGKTFWLGSVEDIVAITTDVVEKQLEFQGEIGILQARAQVKAQQKAASDPVLKFAGAMQGGGL